MIRCFLWLGVMVALAVALWPGGVVAQAVDKLAGKQFLELSCDASCAGYEATDANDTTRLGKASASVFTASYDMGEPVSWSSFRVLGKNGTGGCTTNVQLWRVEGSNTGTGTWTVLTSDYNFGTCDRTVASIDATAFRYVRWSAWGSGCSQCGYWLYTFEGYGTSQSELTPTITPTPTVTHTPTITLTPTATATDTPLPSSTPFVEGTIVPVAPPCGYGTLPPCHVYWQTPGPVYWETPMPITGSITIDNWPTPIPTATTWAGGEPQNTALAVSENGGDPQSVTVGDGWHDFGYDNPVTGNRMVFFAASHYTGPCFDLGLFFDTTVCVDYAWVRDVNIGPFAVPLWPFLVIIGGLVLRFLVQR